MQPCQSIFGQESSKVCRACCAWAGSPPGTFYGNGLLGQRVIVVPKQDLVIVRLGLNFLNDFDPVRCNPLDLSSRNAPLACHANVQPSCMPADRRSKHHVRPCGVFTVQVYGYDFFTNISAAFPPPSSPTAAQSVSLGGR